MVGRSLPWLLVAAFAVAVGHLAWHVGFGPAAPPTYFVSGSGAAMCGAEPGAKNLYLRRTLYLSQHTRHAWLQTLAHDFVRVYVNDVLVEEAELPGYPVAVLADLTPYLKRGK